MDSILSIRMQKCSHITRAVNVLRPFSNGMNMRDVCLQHHPPLDKVKQISIILVYKTVVIFLTNRLKHVLGAQMNHLIGFV